MSVRALVALVLLAGCAPDPSEIRLVVAYDPPALESSFTEGVAIVRRGDCDGEVVHRTPFRPGSAGMRSPALSPGRYCFAVVGWNDNCSVLLSGTTEVRLPRSEAVTVTLRTEGCPGPLGLECAMCEGPTDAGRDAGSDAAPMNDAGLDGGTPAVPYPLWPHNGASTGSAHAPAVTSPFSETPAAPVPPTRPLFRWCTAVTLIGCDQMAPPDVTYEIELTTSCTPALYRSCSFPSDPVRLERTVDVSVQVPAAEPLDVGSLTEPPVGRRYYWRMRARRSVSLASEWAPISYLDVGRLPDDFNGDGYSDVAAAAPAQARVHVFPGRPSVCGSAPPLASDPWTRSAPASCSPGSRFGASLAAAGDIDADGFADLVVGAPDCRGTGLGSVFVYRGGITGPAATPIELTHPSASTEGSFGASVAGAGDVNADGFADLLIGAPDTAAGGTTILFLGAETFPGPRGPVVLAPGDLGPGARFGGSVSGSGDVDADGFADVAVAADGEDEGTGVVRVYLGNDSGVPTMTSVLGNPCMALPTCMPFMPGDRFGTVLAAGGDLNDDGLSDLLVTTPRRAGRVHVYRGTLIFLTGATAYVDELRVDRTEDPDAPYGTALGIGDTNGDSVHDAITASDMFVSGTEQGRVFVHEGGEGIATRAASVIRPPIGSMTTGHGAAVSSGDVNGDGFEDVVVGATGDTGTGVTVHCLRDGIWRVLLRTEVPTDSTNLGASLARRVAH